MPLLAVLWLLLWQPASMGLPVRVLSSADKTKPLIFYISGDGGWNRFSTTLLQQLNAKGFAVVGLDAKTYFQNRKTPAQASADIAMLLLQHRPDWSQRDLVFVGYSFGADVLPFVQTRLPPAIHVKATVLISPSEQTDFEVHLLDWFANSDGVSVVAEINKLTTPVTIFFGAEENRAYIKKVTLKKSRVVILDGGHHYNNDPAALAATLTKAIGL